MHDSEHHTRAVSVLGRRLEQDENGHLLAASGLLHVAVRLFAEAVLRGLRNKQADSRLRADVKLTQSRLETFQRRSRRLLAELDDAVASGLAHRYEDGSYRHGLSTTTAAALASIRQGFDRLESNPTLSESVPRRVRDDYDPLHVFALLRAERFSNRDLAALIWRVATRDGYERRPTLRAFVEHYEDVAHRRGAIEMLEDVVTKRLTF